jgi:hypothetical protein
MWGRSVRLSDRLGPTRSLEPEARGDDEDLQLEQWHESNLGNITYLVIFVIVSILTVLAFVPVWLLLQVQRAGRHLTAHFSPRQ